MQEWISRLFEDKELLRMGHQQRKQDLNLGLGWIYYGLTRVLRPARVVVIGSWRGFVPLVFGRALQDNAEGGEVLFIDPSLVDDFWKDPARVKAYFAGLGVENIRHHALTTQQFVESEPYRALGDVGILFVDGYHTAEQAQFDYEAFESKMGEQGVVLFHDSIDVRVSRRYGEGREYTHTVRHYLDTLQAQRPDLQFFDLPFSSGVTLVRRR